MNKLILLTSCLLTFISIASSVEIICGYSVLHYYVLKDVYSCVILRVIAPENPIVHITGSHMYAKNNDDVHGLKGDIGHLQKFPSEIHNIFKNLQAIYFTDGQIKELIADDLKPFQDLVEIYFDNNKIEVIEVGTFDFNPKLAGISFMNNKIMHISPNVFDHLTDLKYLWLNGNPCKNGVAENDRIKALSLIETAKSTCQNQVFLRMEKKLKVLADNNNNILEASGNVDKNIDSLK